MKSISHEKLKEPAWVVGAPGSKVRLLNALLLHDCLTLAGVEKNEANRKVQEYLEA